MDREKVKNALKLCASGCDEIGSALTGKGDLTMDEANAWVMIPKLRDSTDEVICMRPLVLCKDCIHFEPNNIPEEGCGYCILLDRTFYNDNYCGYGEKVKKNE